MEYNEEIERLKEEFNAKIEELTKRIKEREEEAKMPKGEIWVPTRGEEYWYLDPDCRVYHNIFDGDDEGVENGNAYLTHKKAKFEANREKYTRLFRQYVEQHSEPLDWKNDEQEKWCVYFNYADKSIFFNCRYACKEAGGIFASSEEVMQEAIEFVGESNFKKFVLEVEDVED